MRVFITGGTGLIGRRVTQRLLDRGDHPVVLTRNTDETRRRPGFESLELVQGDPGRQGVWQAAVDGCDAVVNLAGENIFSGRWNAELKRRIRDSRVYGTEHVVEAISQARTKPGVLVQGSAIGYYGAHDDQILDENCPSGSDFLAVVCRELEDAAHQVEALGTRLAIVRTGIVLARGEGALGVMTPIFQWLPGGAAPIGNGGHWLKPATGQQWLSWIHIDDIVGLFLFALDHPHATGALNGTSPNPARNFDFSKTLARVLHRPFLPFGPPDTVLEVALGEMARFVTRGQRVVPSKALELGYAFRHPDLLEALQSALAREKTRVEATA